MSHKRRRNRRTSPRSNRSSQSVDSSRLHSAGSPSESQRLAERLANRQAAHDSNTSEPSDDNGDAHRIPIWRRAWVRAGAAIFLILLPVTCYTAYAWVTRFPNETSIALGPPRGRQAQVAKKLAEQLPNDDQLKRMGLKRVRTGHTRGSLDAVRELNLGHYQFALYQTGTEPVVKDEEYWKLVSEGDRQKKRPKKEGLKGTSLSFNQLKWRRPGREVADEQTRKTKQALGFLGKPTHGIESKSDLLKYGEYTDISKIRFVANLYNEVVHFIVKEELEINHSIDLKGKRIALGPDFTGHYAMSVIILKSLHLARVGEDGWVEFDVDVFQEEEEDDVDYWDQVKEAFLKGELDAAFVTVGVGSLDRDRRLPELLEQKKVKLQHMPNIAALTTQNAILFPTKIPQHIYTLSHPGEDIETVAVRCQLITHVDVDERLVHEVTRIVTSQTFDKENALHEFFAVDPESRLTMHRMDPEFPPHRGAMQYYNPASFDPGQFEWWDALYSLIASVLIGFFFAGRWFYLRSRKRQGHRLDQLIASLMDIDKRQHRLDGLEPGNEEEQEELHALLNKIAVLRRLALRRFTVYELRDDPSMQLFMTMSHNISDKINSKISRQRLDRKLDELMQALAEREPHAAQISVPRNTPTKKPR